MMVSSLRPLPTAKAAVRAQAPAKPEAAPAAAAARPVVRVKAREGLQQLKDWIIKAGATVGAGFGLFFSGLAAIGHTPSMLMAGGLVGGILLGAAVGAFIGSQLADLGEYESGRIQMKYHPH